MPSIFHQALFCFLSVSIGVNTSMALAASGSKSAKEPASLMLSDHPLADSIWSVKSGQKVDKDAVFSKLSGLDHLLIGEKHDNVRHHAIQAEFVTRMGKANGNGKSSVVFEMIEPRHGEALAEAEVGALAGLGEKLDWEKRGWPSWASYQPIFKAALDLGMTLKPGNPNRDMLMTVGRGGELDEAMLKDLRWENKYSEAERESLLDELVDSHCNMMGREAMGPLVKLQRLKDAHMGRAMRQGLEGKTTSILIAGNGHARKDRGVAKFLDKDKKTLSIGLIEVIRNKHDAKGYQMFDVAQFDYVWFTARVDEIDPCEKFRKQLEAMKKKMGKGKSGDKGSHKGHGTGDEAQ